MKRLRDLYPELYDLLLDEERALRGLPARVHYGQGRLQSAVETYQPDALYAALLASGDDDGRST